MRFTTYVLILVASPTAAIVAGEVDEESNVGSRIADFVLPDTAGRQVSLGDFAEAKLVVVAFVGTECPIANAYVPSILELEKTYRDKGVQFLAINPNEADTPEEIAKHAKEYGIPIPVLVDAEQQVARRFAAVRTPEFFLLDARRVIRYRGRLDDRFGYVYRRKDSRRRELGTAIDELLAGKPVSVPVTEPVGCLISRTQREGGVGPVTFSKDVASIIHRRCSTCHHEGTAAPFTLLSYDDVRERGDMIKETVVQRRMPPWSADPRYGHFRNDLRMTDDEIDTLVAWIDNGAPEGRKEDLPATPEFADGWMIGKPDVVFEMPEEFTVPAEGAVEYQYFVSKTNFEEDVYIQAAEARPGNRAVVHHIIVYYREPGTKRKKALPAIVGTAPGEEPRIYAPGLGIKVPAGAELVWEMHYTPNGKVEKDRSSVGIVFCKKPPERLVKDAMAINFRFAIPPHAPNHEVRALSRPFRNDVELISLMPHMHLRGKDFRYEALLPDNSTKVLLNVPTYDFNWQHNYVFEEPIRLPKGTRVGCIAHFDNSNDNPANPDPNKTVRWGDQTWEEMMIGFMKYVDANPAVADQRK